MNEKLELIVNHHGKTREMGCMVMLGMTMFFSFLLFATTLASKYVSIYILLPLQIILGFFLVLFIFALIFYFYLQRKNEPVAILNEEGIWVQHFGFIPWNEVEEVAPYINPGAPLISVGIRVKDPAKLSAQAHFFGKCGVFWSKRFGYPPIILAALDVDNDQVISFAHRFIRPEAIDGF